MSGVLQRFTRIPRQHLSFQYVNKQNIQMPYGHSAKTYFKLQRNNLSFAQWMLTWIANQFYLIFSIWRHRRCKGGPGFFIRLQKSLMKVLCYSLAIQVDPHFNRLLSRWVNRVFCLRRVALTLVRYYIYRISSFKST